MVEAAVAAPSALAALEVPAFGDLVLKLARNPCASAFACEVSAERAGFDGFGSFGAFENPTVLVLREQGREGGSGSTSVLLEQRSERAPRSRRRASQTCSKLVKVHAEQLDFLGEGFEHVAMPYVGHAAGAKETVGTGEGDGR
jgi:hypothetical protein